MNMRILSTAAAFAACVAYGAPSSIECEGAYGGHLQGTDAIGTNVWWSFTKSLVRTDLTGTILASQSVPSHHGDLCVKGDTLYVAVNLGKFNTVSKGVSYVMSYDAMTLAPKEKWKLDMPYGAGGMTWRGDRFYVVGGLPPIDGRNYVHEYDSSFKLIKRHVLHTGYTVLGIQTAAFIDGEFLFGIYGGEGNLYGTLRCPPDLSSFRRYVGAGSLGYAKIDGHIYTGSTLKPKGGASGWSGSLNRADGIFDDAKLFSSPWYSNGVLKDAPMRVCRVALGDGRGGMKFANVGEWRAATKKLADEGYNAVVVDIADGFAYPSHPEIAAKGAWSAKQFKGEIARLREIGLEPIPCIDLSAGRCAWIGGREGSKQLRSLLKDLVKDVKDVVRYARFMQVCSDGRSAEDGEAFRETIISAGYGYCPWPLENPAAHCIRSLKD